MGNMIVCKTPKTESFTSNVIEGTASNYQNAGFDMNFTGFVSIEQVIARLEWMNSKGYHLFNDRGWVWHSKKLAELITDLYKEAKKTREPLGWEARFITRTGGLRSTVINLINEEIS